MTRNLYTSTKSLSIRLSLLLGLLLNWSTTGLALPNCNNVNNGGEIGPYEVVCGAFDPAPIQSIQDPSGGSGTLEIVWLTSTDPELPRQQWTVIDGAHGLSYDPGPISQTTYFLRCSRRAGCDNYIGESNIIGMVVNGLTPDCAANEEVIEMSGNAEEIINNSGVSNANKLLGPINGSIAKFYDEGDHLTVDLRYTLPAGQRYTITWKYRDYNTSYNGPAKLKVYESEDGINFNYVTTLTTEVKDFLVSNTIVASQNTQMIKLENGFGAPDFEVDAISYCNTNCIIEGPRDCSLIDYDITPGASDARLLWMNYPGGVELYSVNLAGASLQEFEDGTAQISGTAERLGQPDYQWIIDVKLINKRNWEEWSALGRDYKANDNVEGADHTTWSYYEMDNDNSTFTGAGLHAGKTLHLTHAPANYNYAFQIGYGANVMNGEYGLSGWFDFHGDINANGDFNGTIDNCTASDPCDNVTDGGEIGDYEVVCGPFDPSIIESIEDPTGGSGDLEIVWLTSTNPELPPWEWDVIEGATDLTYDPGFITVTTYFLRCTRREGCEEYLGESNIIAKVVNSFTPDCAPSEELIDVLGYAEKVKQNNGVDQANELLGAADGKPAKFYDANDNLLVDLRYNLPAGDRYTITWKFRYYNTSLGDTARLNVYESTDGVNFTLATTLKTSIRHFYVSQTITAGRDTRMIKLENDGSGPDFDVDAITFCNSTCISENPADCPLLDYETLEGANNTRLLWMRYSEGVELYSVNLSGASLKEYPDGTASITGTAERVGNPDYKWIINVRLVNKRNWEEWSALGRDYKPNDFFSGADHTTWTYYELDNNNSTFTGEGLHAGKTLNLTHAPANYNYAFQIGYGANVKNGEYGLSGWFDFTGDINAYGDFNGTLEECSFEDCITLNLSVDLNVTAAIDCQGEASGQLEAIPSEGLPPYSFLWSTGDTTQMVDSLPAGSYTVSITDDFGCVATTSIELLEPNEMTLSSVSEDTDCLDGETGSIDLTVEGGTAPYTFIWSNGATSEDINNLAANTYYVTVTDTKGCTAIHEDQITEPPLLEANCTAGPAICQGANNGIIELVVNGGTAPYTYSWSNGASSQNLDNLNEGTYSVIVTDANGCTSTCEASIQTSTDLVLSCSASNTDCSNITSGSISVNVEGGLAPFSFAWSNGATTQDLNEVPEGTYSLTVTDANNCSASCTATIENTPAIELNCTATDINCEGNNDGIITTTVTGGTPPFQYTWSNGATASNLDGLAEGTYSLTVSDANNCDAICSVTINAPTSLQAVCTATQSGCGADVLGDITLTVTGGTAPYTYQWNNEANGQNLLGVEAGSYSVIITDANGCVTQCGASIEPHSAIELTCSATNPTCNEQADAIITSNISGGTAPFTYAWSNGATSQNLDNLNAGTYTLTVTDAEGCSAVCSTTIEAPASLTANCQVSQSGCDANTAGDINLIVMGGTAPYTFAWNNGDTNQDLNAVPAGDYSVIITDANGCTATCSTTVESVSGFELACSPTPTNCADANSGSITVNLTGGLAPFSFNWSNGANSQDLTAVPAGSYSLTVTDANNCQAICTTVIEEAPGLNLSCSATEVDCNGGTTGEITTIVTGGVPPFIYTWSNSATTANLDNLPAGNYDLTVTDANACTAVCTASVNESSSLEVICTADQDPCGPNITGNINLNVTGGNSPYTFLWNTGASSQNLNNVSPGEYEVTITDANGCSTSCGASIIAYEELTASCLSTDAICSDLESGDVALTVTGGLLPYTYLWSNGATSKDLINIHAGIFTVTVTDANGCTASCSATVEASEAIFTNLTSSDASCFGSADGSIDLSIIGGTPPFTYDWINGYTGQDPDSLAAGVYTATITDANGCTATCEACIGQPELLVGTCTSSPVCGGVNNGQIQLSVTGGTSPYTYLWSNGATTQNLVGVANGQYEVTITDANDCEATCSSIVNNPVELTADCTVEPGPCEGTDDILLTVGGGTPPYTYLWSNGATSQQINDLAPATYMVTVSDELGCTAVCSASIEATVSFQATCEAVHILCAGEMNGGVNLSIIGGAAPYTFAWSNGETTQNLSGVDAGTYSVLITDANGCMTTCNTEVLAPTALVTNCSATPTTCAENADGRIEALISGGTAPYTFAWSNGATSQNLNDLAAGTYSLTATDANGCSITCSSTISAPASLAVVCTPSNASCTQPNSGAISLNITGGTAPFSFTWSNGATSQDLIGLSTGAYEVTITDTNGCTATCMASVEETSPIQLAIGSTNPACTGSNSGTISLTVNGGTAPYTFNWSNGGTTQDLNNLAAGTYGVTVSDANGCTNSLSADVTEIAGVSITCSAADAACGGEASGSVTTNISGGLAPFTFNWNNGATSQNLDAVIAGAYEVTITDANGCTATCSAVVNQPNQMFSIGIATPALCPGEASGIVNLTVLGGAPPYQYIWSNGVTVQDLSAVPAGTYSVTITDAIGCTSVSSTVVSEPAALTTTCTPSATICGSTTTGDIQLDVEGGTAPYFFTWSNGSITQNINDLAAGNYIVTVTDNNGCSTTCEASIIEYPTLSVSCIATDATCDAPQSGSIAISITGGTAPFSYSWSNGATSQTVSDLSAGEYTITVTDANNCVATCTASIIELSPLDLSCTPSSPSCLGQASGQIELVVSNGTAPYTYLWSNGAVSENLMNIPAGDYSVTVTDANGCTSSCSASVTDPVGIAATCSATPAECFGSATGSISLMVSNGQEPYSFAWNNGATDQNLSDLMAGIYTVTITDANGCTTTCSTTVDQPSPMFTSCSATDAGCQGEASGNVNLTVVGGVRPLSYEWSNGVVVEDLSGVPAGSYSVTITDATGCTATCATVVSEPEPITTTCTPTDASCGGVSDGAISVDVSGGVPPYDFEWSSGQFTEDLDNIPAGTYTLTITDQNGCTASCSTNIDEPNPINANTSVVNASCTNENAGAVNLTVSGGEAPYTFMWSTGDTTQNISNLMAGFYSVTITDDVSCEITSSAIVISTSPVFATCTASPAQCFGEASGQVELTITDGTAPYTYAWNNGATSQNLSNVVAGLYSVIVTDANGCTAECSAIVGQPAAIELVPSITDAICFGDASGQISLSVNNGTAPFTYNWSNGANTAAIFDLLAGSYSVTVSDANACEAVLNVFVNQPQPIFTNCIPTDAACFGEASGQVSLVVVGGAKPLSYAWSNGAISKNLANVAAGSYTVTITDQNGCTATCTSTVGQPEAINITCTPSDILCGGTPSGSIAVNVSGGLLPYTYLWSNGATTSDLQNIPAGSYSVSVTDASGCMVACAALVEENIPLTTETTITNANCAQANSGGIELSVFGGTAPYTYNWSNGATSQNISGIEAGDYTASILDANGCLALVAVSVEELSPVQAQCSSTNVSCAGLADGQIALTVTNGVAPYTYTWSDGSTAQNLMNVSAGLYEVTIVDANGCTATCSSIITEPTAISLTCTATDALCFDSETGSVAVAVSNGVAPYTFAWSNGATTQDLLDVSAGDYQLTVTDANGCTATCNSTVWQAAPIITSCSASPTDCGDISNGSVNLTVVGGARPLSYLWSNGATTEDITGLALGTYVVTITDINGCTAICSSSVETASGLSLSCQANPNECGGQIGSVISSVSGGAIPYSYQWNNGASSSSLLDVPAGDYSLTVTDANGCSAICSSTLTTPSAMSLECSATALSCALAQDGTVALALTGGQAPYTYNWSNGATNSELSNLPAGTYTVVVTDAYGCTVSCSATVESPEILSALCLSSPTSPCSAAGTGSISLLVSGGNGDYSYLWSNGATTSEISGLNTGTYGVTVTDGNGCSTTCVNTIEVGPDMIASCSSNGVGCSGQASGSIDLTVNNGQAPYSYQWSNGATSANISNLDAGTYSVTVTDVNGCTAICSAEVIESEPIFTHYSVNDVDCHGDSTGSVYLSVIGGSEPLTFTWSNGGSSPYIDNLIAGVYWVTITDANGCAVACSAKVRQPQPLNASCITTQPNCANGGVGEVKANVFGGTLPYSFLWNSGEISQTIHPSIGGTYEVTITDWNGCTTICRADISESIGIMAQCSISDTICAGAANGVASVTVIGGMLPYSYEWSNGATSSSIDSLVAGIYEVTVMDANACSSTCTVEIVSDESCTTPEFQNIDPSIDTQQGSSDFSEVMSIYPVPVRQELNVNYYLKSAQRIHILVYDLSGTVLQVQEFDAHEGFNQVRIDTDDLLNGSYLISIQTAEDRQSQAFIKM